jgi:hypothetical protein
MPMRLQPYLFLFQFLAVIQVLTAQPIILTVQKTVSCSDNSAVLTAQTNGRFLGWEKSDGSKEAIQNPDSLQTLVKPLVGKATYIASAYFDAFNLIVNGDFEQDSVGLKTEYTYKDRIDQPGDYAIETNPNAGRSTHVYAYIGDHTTGNGKMFVADGDSTLKSAFKAYVPVQEGVTYQFTAWIANIHKKLIAPNTDTSVNKMPRLLFEINGQSVGVYDFPFDSLWHSFSRTWVASKTETIRIDIIDLQKSLKANDFALDDVSFTSATTKTANVVVEPCLKSDVFSPNGDGIYDSYYIEESGKAKIYDLGGNLVRELDAPAYWDGLKANGALADAGFYAVVVNSGKVFRLSLIR